MLFFFIRINIAVLFLSLIDLSDKQSLAAGRTYEGTAEGPCIEWSNKG